IMDGTTGEQLRILKGPGPVTFSGSPQPDGSYLSEILGETDLITTLAFSPDGKRVATAGMDCTGRVWDAEKGGQLVPADTRLGVRSVAFTPDGKSLRMVAENQKVRSWDWPAGKETHEHAYREIRPFLVVLSANGDMLAVNDWNGKEVY